MPIIEKAQRISTGLSYTENIEIWINQFLVDCKSRNLAKGTLAFYRDKLKDFCRYCENQAATEISQIDAVMVRNYLLWLETKGHNPGGIHAAYRSIKVFLRWYVLENEPETWTNPLKKVKAPKVPEKILEPATPEQINKLLEVCTPDKKFYKRDKAIILMLIDTGIRASELCNLDVADVNLVTGEINIRQGKGGKQRYIFAGRNLRRALRSYLKNHTGRELWTTKDNERLTYGGLRAIITRHSEEAGIEPPPLHSFRRAFALSMLRAGCNVFTLQKLMGHSDLKVLLKYLKQSTDDLHEAHAKASPGDSMQF